MKRTVILFLISLLATIAIFSQNISYPKQISDSTVEITAQQLKQTNLIFVEHNTLKAENKELNLQISKYQELVNNYKKQDSINNIKINELMEFSTYANNEMVLKDKEISKLKHTKKNLKLFTICGFSISALLGVLLFVK